MITLALIATIITIVLSVVSIRNSVKTIPTPTLNRFDGRSASKRAKHQRARRVALAAVSFAVLMIGGIAGASVTGFFAWSGTGNGRGGQSAARPTCSNDFRGRTWALYGASSASSDALQVCLYTSGGGNEWVAVPR